VKEIRHDQTVEWLAHWKDPINPQSPTSTSSSADREVATDSDTAKYEKARKRPHRPHSVPTTNASGRAQGFLQQRSEAHENAQRHRQLSCHGMMDLLNT
jgi:hypothetical protein